MFLSLILKHCIDLQVRVWVLKLRDFSSRSAPCCGCLLLRPSERRSFLLGFLVSDSGGRSPFHLGRFLCVCQRKSQIQRPEKEMCFLWGVKRDLERAARRIQVFPGQLKPSLLLASWQQRFLTQGWRRTDMDQSVVCHTADNLLALLTRTGLYHGSSEHQHRANGIKNVIFGYGLSVLSCSLSLPPNILNDSVAVSIIWHVRKHPSPRGRNAKGKAPFWSSVTLRVFSEHLVASPLLLLKEDVLSSSRMQYFRNFLPHPERLLSSLSPHPDTQIIMATFSEQLFRCRFARRKLDFSCNGSSFPFTLLTAAVTPGIWGIPFSLIFEYRKVSWAVVFSLITFTTLPCLSSLTRGNKKIQFIFKVQLD